jgi:hypothetical protein
MVVANLECCIAVIDVMVFLSGKGISSALGAYQSRKVSTHFGHGSLLEFDCFQERPGMRDSSSTIS